MKAQFVVASLALVSGSVLSAGCDSEYSVHSISFIDNATGSIGLYADETSDSCGIQAYDSWTASSGDTTWLTCTPTSVTVPSGYVSMEWFYVAATPNTTGQNRSAFIDVDSYYDLRLYVQQSANLNIGHPTGTSVEGTDVQSFTLAVNPLGARDSISFTVYADGATLGGTPNWLTLTDSVFEKGAHTVYVDVVANWTGNNRSATLTLTSAGVSNDIQITQSVPTN